MNDLPESVARVIGQLRRRGFALTDERRSAAFGDRLLVFRRDPVELRIVRDRGQWSMDLTAAGWAEGDRVDLPVIDRSGE